MSVKVDFSCSDGVEFALDENELTTIFDLVLDSESVTRPCLVSVSIVDAQSMQAINNEWRGIDTPTDVISLECERPDDPDLADGEPCELGDIFMAPDVLKAQSIKFGTTEADETRLMAIHSLLHLLGYDHLQDEEAEIMEEREDELLAKVCKREIEHVHLTRHRHDGEA